MRELALILNEARPAGAIDFDLPEPLIESTSFGRDDRCQRSPQTIAHRLIENSCWRQRGGGRASENLKFRRFTDPRTADSSVCGFRADCCSLRVFAGRRGFPCGASRSSNANAMDEVRRT